MPEHVEDCNCIFCEEVRVLKQKQHIFQQEQITRSQEAFQKSVNQTQLPMTSREKILEEARIIVTKDRNSTYGNPEDNFKDIANLWEAYKGVKFTSMDVVIMNMLIKVARLKKTPSYHDGLVDIAGYAACGGDIQKIIKQHGSDSARLGGTGPQTQS